MTPSPWILTVIAIIGCSKLVADIIFAIGRWSKGVESGDHAQKPKVTLERISWELEGIGREVREVRSLVEGRYAELSARLTADHQLVRELLNWKAGIFSELSQHFYTIPMIDRIAEEGKEDRIKLRKDLDQLKEFAFSRRSGDRKMSDA